VQSQEATRIVNLLSKLVMIPTSSLCGRLALGKAALKEKTRSLFIGSSTKFLTRSHREPVVLTVEPVVPFLHRRGRIASNRSYTKNWPWTACYMPIILGQFSRDFQRIVAPVSTQILVVDPSFMRLFFLVIFVDPSKTKLKTKHPDLSLFCMGCPQPENIVPTGTFL